MNKAKSEQTTKTRHFVTPDPWILLPVVSFLLLGIVVVLLPISIIVSLIAGVLGICIAYTNPHWFLGLLLILRSSADGIQDLFTFFPGKWYSFNLAGMLNIVVVGFSILILFRRFLRKDRLIPHPTMFLLLAFLIVSFISAPQSLDVNASLKAWVRLFGYFGIMLVTYEVIEQGKLSARSLARFILIASIPPLILGYYQAFTDSGYYFPGYQSTSFVYRPQGTFGHPAILASFLIIITYLSLSSYFLNYHLCPRWLLLIYAIGCMGLIILTFARTQWIGAIVGLSIIGLIRSRKMILLLFMLAIVLIFAVPTIQERIQGEQATESFEWRLEVWQASLRTLRQPTLFGTGLDTSHISINNILVNVFVPPHNDYLRMAMEVGLIGLLTYLLLQVSLFITLWKTYQCADTVLRMFALSLLGILTAGWVISISDNYLSFVSVQWYFWSLIGTLLGLQSKKYKENVHIYV